MKEKIFLTEIGYTYNISKTGLKVNFETKYVDDLYDFLHKNYNLITSKKVTYCKKSGLIIMLGIEFVQLQTGFMIHSII